MNLLFRVRHHFSIWRNLNWTAGSARSGKIRMRCGDMTRSNAIECGSGRRSCAIWRNFSNLWPGKAFAQTSKDLKQLQDLLGALNDAIAGERLLGQVVEEARKPSVNFAADLIRQHEATSGDVAIKAIKVHKRLRTFEPFWAQI